MDKSLFQIILHTFTFSGVLCRHVFVSHHRNWTDAQELCRNSYTDLSPVTSQWDAASLHQVFQDSLSWEKPFYCISLLVVNDTKAWEEALEHCRQWQSDLLSNTTQHVWIGLQYPRMAVGERGPSAVPRLEPSRRNRHHHCGRPPPPHQHPHCAVLNGSCGAMTREGVCKR
ncbi:unnamed protein product [Merluccius merluccius]